MEGHPKICEAGGGTSNGACVEIVFRASTTFGDF
jgi:hypothetical protein